MTTMERWNGFDLMVKILDEAESLFIRETLNIIYQFIVWKLKNQQKKSYRSSKTHLPDKKIFTVPNKDTASPDMCENTFLK